MNSEPCTFHRKALMANPSREAGARPKTGQPVHWCIHPKHSPLPPQIVHRALRGRLTCGGDTGGCPLTPDQFWDLV